ncbi:MAG: sensor histidine kinase [Candidatus Binatia bacterium]
MNQDGFSQKVESLQQRLQTLRQQKSDALVRQPQLSTKILEELGAALEELHVAQAELQQQNEELIATRHVIETERRRYQELFEFAPDGYLVTDAQGVIREANLAAATLLNVRQQHLAGKPLIVFIVEEDRKILRMYLMQLQEKGHSQREWEARVQPRESEPFPAAFTVAPVHDSQGRVVALRWLLRDIADRKQTLEELKLAKEAAEAADRTKSEFLAAMSHELRTPLGVILGYDTLLLEGAFGALTTEQLRPLRRMNENANELLELINAVLDLSRLEKGRLPIDIREVKVSELLAMLKEETLELQEQSSLSFVWWIAERLPSLHTDPGKLKMVLKNLIGNAVKFTERGSITVTAQSCEGGVEIRVTDTGIGIPPEALAYIFEPFRQVHDFSAEQHKGTGLGLHIVKRLLELLGGSVVVESEIGRGSTFCVWMPPLSEPGKLVKPTQDL